MTEQEWALECTRSSSISRIQRPRLWVGILALNEEDYLQEALECLYPVAHKIIIVEGACQYAWPFASAKGLSTDNTWRIIEKGKDPEKKIIHLPVGRQKTMADLRNRYWDLVPEEDFLLVADADEGWWPLEIGEACNYLYQHPKLAGITVQHTMLIGDFRHYEPGAATSARLWRRALMPPYQPHGDLGDMPQNYHDLPLTEVPFPFRNLHFGWVRQSRRLLQKMVFTGSYLQALYGWKPEVVDLPRYLLEHHHAFTGRNMDTGTPVNFPVYQGDLPAPFARHPLASLTREEILSDYLELCREHGLRA